MNLLFEMLRVILPAIVAGMFTFLVTKYTYSRNIPLDNLRITYNRVYYPIYRIVKNDNIDIDTAIEKIKCYVKKYDKYVDRSTLRAFNYVYKCNTDAKKKNAYQNLKNNIYDKNSYLRRRLGYLEPNFIQMYIYFSDAEKSTFRILTEFCAIYLLVIITGMINGKIQSLFAGGMIILIVILVIEIICKFAKFLYYKIRK